MYRRTIVCKSSEDSKTSAYLNEKVTFFYPSLLRHICRRYMKSMCYERSSKYDNEVQHVALKNSGEGLDVSLLSSYKKYTGRSTDKNSQF